MRKHYFISLALLIFCFASCADKDSGGDGGDNGGNGGGGGTKPPEEVVYDDTNCHYKSYNGLVMAGYQGWYTAEGDGADRGWYHYEKNGQFRPEECGIDFWPDMTEYTKTYQTEFQYPNGNFANIYSPMDESTIDLHFKWMKEYGIDGVFMQRFMVEIITEKGKNHFNTVLKHALKAAKKYDRAICVMYDLTGMRPERGDFEALVRDWEELQSEFKLFDNEENPTYLWHDKRPLLAIWGVGFDDGHSGRLYTTNDVANLVDKVKGDTKKCSVMLGLPYWWRTGVADAEKNNSTLFSLIKKCDIIMPWAVGRYSTEESYAANNQIAGDMMWCVENNLDYAVCCFPGFSWANKKAQNESDLENEFPYDQIPRNGGAFLWKQIYGAVSSGVQSIYVAMFDEMDEGTAIYKCALTKDLPLNGNPPWRFVGIDDNLQSDHYLWLTGMGAKILKKDAVLGPELPER